MNHIAIMNPKVATIADILSGKKTIESRWSKHKSAPWGKVHLGDIIYFKETGQDVTAQAVVTKVVSIDNLNKNFGRQMANGKNYCTLIFLKDPKTVEPFKINKSGFGAPVAWLCVEDIEQIKI